MDHIPDLVLLLVRYIHITAGVLWVGGLVYAGMVVGKNLATAPPQVRGPAMARIGMPGFRLLNWMAIVTIVFGVGNEALMTMAIGDVGDALDRWHMTLGFGLLISLAMLGIAHAMVRPSLKKMAAFAAAATPPAPADVEAVQKRLVLASTLGVVLGAAAILTMVIATRMRAGP